MEKYVVKNGKKMRIGYTTGSCATAASTAAAHMLLTGERIPEVSVILPGGEEVIFHINNIDIKDKSVSCSVTKDGGDDPDATTGLEIFSCVKKTESGFVIDGGNGVGRVTEEGLRCAVGEAAINPVPRKMIKENVLKIIKREGYTGGMEVVISVPGGEETAKHTFNGMLGIKGGISILGTTGIVDPMSEQALIDTIKTSVDREKTKDPNTILIAPGNYGEEFCKNYLELDITRSVQISNFVGEALDYIRYRGFKEILFAGHTGKLIKTAAGIMNTHSLYADGRMEIIGVYSAMAGATPEMVKKIMKCVTTDKAFDVIKDEPYFQTVKESILEASLAKLRRRLRDEVRIEVVMFTSDHDNVIMSDGAEELIKKFRKE